MKMLPMVLILSLLATGIVGAAPPDEAADKAREAQQLQGTWKIVAAEFSGMRKAAGEIGIDQIVVSGETMTLKRGDQAVATYKFELYPDRKPKGLLWKKEGQGLLPTIYEIDGAKLKLCFPLLGTEEPAAPPQTPQSFDTQDKPLGLLIAEREKP